MGKWLLTGPLSLWALTNKNHGWYACVCEEHVTWGWRLAAVFWRCRTLVDVAQTWHTQEVNVKDCKYVPLSVFLYACDNGSICKCMKSARNVWVLWVRVWVRVHRCMCVCVRVCMGLDVCACWSAWMSVCVCMCVRICWRLGAISVFVPCVWWGTRWCACCVFAWAVIVFDSAARRRGWQMRFTAQRITDGCMITAHTHKLWQVAGHSIPLTDARCGVCLCLCPYIYMFMLIYIFFTCSW